MYAARSRLLAGSSLKRVVATATVGITALAAFALAQPEADAATGFLSRSGGQLTLNGKPYTYVSFNAYGMTGQETGTPYSRSVLDAYFESLPTKSLTRTWAWKNNGITGVDAVVASAAAKDQMVILSLSEGAGFDHLGKKDEAWFASGYKTDLLPWVRQVVAKHKDSPAIGMWEIMNEPGNKSAVNGSVSNATMKSFFDTVAAEIKGIDTNHLVTTGTMDANQQGMTDFGNLHAGANIDVASIHEYADEYEGGILVSSNYTQGVAKLKAAGVDKPVILGEIGVPGADSGCRTRAERVDVVRKKADAYFAAGADGINLWNWFPNKNNACQAGQSIYPGDPLIPFVNSYKGVSQQTAGTSATPGSVKPVTPSSVTPTIPASTPGTAKPATPTLVIATLPTIPSLKGVASSGAGGGTGSSSDSTLDDNGAAFTYSGTWSTAQQSGKSGGSDHFTYETGAKVSISFTGSKIDVYGATASHHGTADVFIDGKLVATIDQSSPTRAENQLVFTSGGLTSGRHAIDIVNTSPQDSNPWNGVIAIDRVVTTG
jgi:mannan endo-1,4-beta-mannosidase